MRKIAAVLVLGVTLSTVAGCGHFFNRLRQPEVGQRDRFPAASPTAPQLVSYVNKNARKVKALQATNVTMTINPPQGVRNITLNSADIFVQKPRSFRLMAKILTSPGVDIGSNDKEFWYWISKAENAGDIVFHCDYDSMERGAQTGLPFHPDMITTALGIGELDPEKQYQVKTNRETIELIEQKTSPQGQPIQSVTVFTRRQVTRQDQPQVIAHVVRDQQGNEISRASITQVQVQRTPVGETVILPRRVNVVTNLGNGQKAEMRLIIGGLKVVDFSPEQSASLFSRAALSRRLRSFNIATRQFDGANGSVNNDRIRRTRGDDDNSLMPR